MEKTVYKKMITEIVEQVNRIIGPVAVVQANTVKGLKVTASGDVDINGDPVDKINQLVKAYKVLIGSVAITLAKKGIEKTLKDNPKIKIPKELRE